MSLDPDIYNHLRALAEQIYSEKGQDARTIQPTILLHEAWIRMERSGNQYSDRRHFIAVAARAMRQILTDQARKRATQKRGGDHSRTTLSGVGFTDRQLDVLDLQLALEELEAIDPQGAEVVQLRIFGGMTVPEVAETLSLGASTVDRAWSRARAFLNARLGD